MTNGNSGNYTEGFEGAAGSRDDLFILDVREPHEYQICNLNGKLDPARRTPPAP